jgi:hypothetical protein
MDSSYYFVVNEMINEEKLTQAETIAKKFDDFGDNWVDADGRSFESHCDESAIHCDNGKEYKLYKFLDR